MDTDQVPVVKATNCILAMLEHQVRDTQPEMPCIRCMECVNVCPASLLPQQLYWYTRNNELEQVQRHGIFDCIECGCCAYVCPSHIPLVDYYRDAKSAIWKVEERRQKAEHARRRHEFRERRKRLQAADRTERLRKRDRAATGEKARDEIAAAVKRARQRKTKKNDDGSDE